MKSSIAPKLSSKLINKIILGLLVIGLNQSVNGQVACSYLSLDYNVNQSYYALGVSNNRLEESEFIIEIENASYTLDGALFNNSNGIQLTVTTTQRNNGKYDHTLTPNQPIGSYQYLNFVYNGSPANTNNNYNASSEVLCAFEYVPLVENLRFNFFNESQYYFGFGISNDNSTSYFPYEIHVDNATYQIDETQLNHDGFDFFAIDNGDGTFDYYFLAQDPIGAYSGSPVVSSSQNFGPGATSSVHSILSGSNIVSSGINGGLESHGGLASKIALRNFKRALGKDTSPEFKIDNTVVSELAPQHILAGDQLIESSPTDLVAITAAETVWAGDYFINDIRFASVFGSKTSEEVYDHTKVICDRVKGSELAAVEVVNIDGYETILSIIRRPNKTIEYAISFSLAYKDHGEFTMASNWAIDEYESSPNFLNYQVWTNSKAKSIAAVQHIIENVVTQNGYILHKASESPSAPKLFARRAHYRLGAFHLELNNRLTEATTVEITGTCTNKEIDGDVIPFNREIEIIPGQTSLTLELENGNIFDGQISLKTADNQKDVIYLADGSWGLEYDATSTFVEQVEIIADDRTEENNDYLVERGISVSGSTDSYISIFKQLVPGGLAVDLTEYNTLSFDSTRSGVYEITLLIEGNTDPSMNFSHTLHTGGESQIDIPFALFSNALGEEMDASNITTIYVAFEEANNDGNEFDFSIENVRFHNHEDSNLSIIPSKLNLYPNPSDGAVQLTHMFATKTDVQITVYDTKGSIVKQMTAFAYEGLQNFALNFDNNEKGLFLVTLQKGDSVYTETLLLR